MCPIWPPWMIPACGFPTLGSSQRSPKAAYRVPTGHGRSGVEAVGVVDQNLAPGRGGILFPEVKAALFEKKIPVSSFIISLGGKHISREEFEKIGLEVLESVKTRKPRVMWQGKFLQ